MKVSSTSSQEETGRGVGEGKDRFVDQGSKN
jgi:hypothetical protein